MGNVLPTLMPSTSLSETLRSTVLSVSLAASTVVFWWQGVVVKAARERVDVVDDVVARRRAAAAVLCVKADMMIDVVF